MSTAWITTRGVVSTSACLWRITHLFALLLCWVTCVTAGVFSAQWILKGWETHTLMPNVEPPKLSWVGLGRLQHEAASKYALQSGLSEIQDSVKEVEVASQQKDAQVSRRGRLYEPTRDRNYHKVRVFGRSSKSLELRAKIRKNPGNCLVKSRSRPLLAVLDTHHPRAPSTRTHTSSTYYARRIRGHSSRERPHWSTPEKTVLLFIAVGICC